MKWKWSNVELYQLEEKIFKKMQLKKNSWILLKISGLKRKIILQDPCRAVKEGHRFLFSRTVCLGEAPLWVAWVIRVWRPVCTLQKRKDSGTPARWGSYIERRGMLAVAVLWGGTLRRAIAQNVGSILYYALCYELPNCCFLERFLVKVHIHFILFRAWRFFGWDADLMLGWTAVCPV